MSALSQDAYARLIDSVEMKLDEADKEAETTEKRLSHEYVFRNIKNAIHDKWKIQNYWNIWIIRWNDYMATYIISSALLLFL